MSNKLSIFLSAFKIFFSCGFSASYMPLFLVAGQHLAGLFKKRTVKGIKSFGYIFMYS